jgi:hypothetical protein
VCCSELVGWLVGRAAAFSTSYFSITVAQVFCVRAEWARLGADRRQLVSTILDLFYLPLFSSCKNIFFWRYDEIEETPVIVSGARSPLPNLISAVSPSPSAAARSSFCHCVVLFARPRNKMKYISRRRTQTKS